MKVYSQDAEINALLHKSEPCLNHYDSENEYDELISLKSDMSNVLDRYQILNQYDEEKSYSELARYDIRLKYKRLEMFDFEQGSLRELSDMAVQKYGFITTKFRRKAWSRIILSNREKSSLNNKQKFNTISIDFN